MTTTQRMLVAVFDDRAQAEQAVSDLQNAGFNPDQIRFAGRGPSTGSALEKLKSLFTGQDTGTAYNDLVSMGVPANDASYYQQEYEAGHSIVAIMAAEGLQEARDILARYGGYGANNQRFAQTAETARTGVREAETEGEQRLKLREEQLRAQKQTVETGEARLHKDVVTEQKSFEVPVTHEEVYVERRPASGQPADQPIGEQGEVYRVPVREEQLTVEKQPVEREEIALGKRPVQETKQVSDTVRREEAHIEQSGNINVRGNEVEDTTDQGRP